MTSSFADPLASLPSPILLKSVPLEVIEKEKRIPTLHLKRRNGIKKITMDCSWLFRRRLGSVTSNSRSFRGVCHEPWVDT